MNKKIRWTNDEDIVIINYVKQFPDNKAEAFRRAEKHLINRTLKSIKVRYYFSILKSNNFHATVGSSIGFTTNRKNNPVKNGVFKREEPLQPVIVVMQQMLNLSKKDRIAIINFLQNID